MGIPNMVKKASKNKVEVTPEVSKPKEDTKQVDEAVVDDNSIEQTFKNLYEKINTLKTELGKLVSDVKEVHKQVNKSLKESAKNKKKKQDRPKREPSGFAKPTPISQELCDFLQKPIGTEMARTEVTKYLTQYIKEHKLQFEEDKRKIKPDTKLKK